MYQIFLFWEGDSFVLTVYYTRGCHFIYMIGCILYLAIQIMSLYSQICYNLLRATNL